MSLITTEKTFKYAELSDAVKATVRQSYVEDDYPGYEWWTFDDAVHCAKLLGIEIEEKFVKTKSGGYIHVGIYFSGFSSQGDGASFTGRYRCAPNAITDIKAHAPLDETLHKIAEGLTALQVSAKLVHGDQLEAEITSGRSNYCHSGTMDVNVLASCEPTCGSDDLTEESVTRAEEDAITALLRRFADWIYSELQAQHDYLHSDSYLDEQIENRDEDYTVDGVVVN